MKIMIYLAVLTTLSSASTPCTRDTANLLDSVKTNGVKSVNALHDYVWVLERHQTVRDKKGNVKTYTERVETVVADGLMYRRWLHQGEEPQIPGSKAALSSGYIVGPALDGNCGDLPCGSIPEAFFPALFLPLIWDAITVREDKLNGVSALVIDLRAKHFPGSTFQDTGSAWVDPEHCRLLRLVKDLRSNGSNGEEIVEFGEVKGNWFPIKKEIHSVAKDKTYETTEEYTYLKFGASTHILP